jgi:hypothetical protein
MPGTQGVGETPEAAAPDEAPVAVDAECLGANWTSAASAADKKNHYHQCTGVGLRKGGMYSLTMARAHPYRGFFWQSVLIIVVALAH